MTFTKATLLASIAVLATTMVVVPVSGLDARAEAEGVESWRIRGPGRLVRSPRPHNTFFRHSDFPRVYQH